MAASYQGTTRELFIFSHPEEWAGQSHRFEYFQQASGLKQRDDEMQINTLIYSMGDNADHILRLFRLSEPNPKKYDVVLKCKLHFDMRRDLIFEQAKFNMHKLAEHWLLRST